MAPPSREFCLLARSRPIERVKNTNMRHGKLLDPQPLPVMIDIFLHDLDARTIESLHRALAQGLVPTAVDFGGNDHSIVIIRFTPPRAGGSPSDG